MSSATPFALKGLPLYLRREKLHERKSGNPSFDSSGKNTTFPPATSCPPTEQAAMDPGSRQCYHQLKMLSPRSLKHSEFMGAENSTEHWELSSFSPDSDCTKWGRGHRSHFLLSDPQQSQWAMPLPLQPSCLVYCCPVLLPAPYL